MASRIICGTWVVFPEPVSLWIISMSLEKRVRRMDSEWWRIGRAGSAGGGGRLRFMEKGMFFFIFDKEGGGWGVLCGDPMGIRCKIYGRKMGGFEPLQ